MKAIKLVKKDLKTCEALLRKADAIYKNRAFPSHVYVSNEDNKTLMNNVREAFIKKFPGLKKKGSKDELAKAVGMEILNIGPSTVLGSVIKEGFILVDDTAIEAETQSVKEEESSYLKKGFDEIRAAEEEVDNLSIWQKLLSKNPFKKEDE